MNSYISTIARCSKLSPALNRAGIWLLGCMMLGACATPARQGDGNGGSPYPLQMCRSEQEKNCVVGLFRDDQAIKTRDPQGFPKRYLELADPAVRAQHCAENPDVADASGKAKCEVRLKALSGYFNPEDKRPADDDLAVALEGGGSKTAPYSLGVLAGLNEMNLLQTQVRAISSISGGSYAASFLYNRIYDKYIQKEYPQADDYKQWFASCIPDYFIAKPYFQLLKQAAEDTQCGEYLNAADKANNEFRKAYRFQGHVWRNLDLLRGDSEGNLRVQKNWRLAEIGNIGLLTTETAATIPFQFVARTVFRWPLNSSPSKLAYKLGIERQYGYSPNDWRDAGSSDWAHLWNTLNDRRKHRTLSNLYRLEEALIKQRAGLRAPLWIIGTTAPGSVTLTHWIQAAARDPIRQQFEITTHRGFGSGTYGYARQFPDAPFDFMGRNPDGLPILDAVVASAAFFDDDQTQISKQPFRFFSGALQHFGNVTWFSEIRNFNVKDSARYVANLLPWPFYLMQTNKNNDTPYIHLQDGGNTDNSGIFPLLRRGYKKIIYAHGTEDKKARFAAICHLKNQLELDGSYFLTSDDLERIIEKRRMVNPYISKGRFKTYLDALCAAELDESDLLVFDQNPHREPDSHTPAVAKLYCARLADKKDFEPCEDIRKFDLTAAKAAALTGPNPARFDDDLFFNWDSNTKLHFKVYRGDSLDARQYEAPNDVTDLISTIIALVPGISPREIRQQMNDPQSDLAAWEALCTPNAAIQYCHGPDNQVLSTGFKPQIKQGLSCTALAHVIEDTCTSKESSKRPQFPQDSFVAVTLHNTYTSYAAYFDLGRHHVHRALHCVKFPQDCGPAHR